MAVRMERGVYRSMEVLTSSVVVFRMCRTGMENEKTIY